MTSWVAPGKLTGNPLPREQQQPGLERTLRRIVLEFGDVLAHRNDRFLNRVFSLRFAQPGFARHPINQTPVGVEKLLPTLSVIRILQAAEQTASRRQQFVGVLRHGLGLCHSTDLKRSKQTFLSNF